MEGGGGVEGAVAAAAAGSGACTGAGVRSEHYERSPTDHDGDDHARRQSPALLGFGPGAAALGGCAISLNLGGREALLLSRYAISLGLSSGEAVALGDGGGWTTLAGCGAARALGQVRPLLRRHRSASVNCPASAASRGRDLIDAMRPELPNIVGELRSLSVGRPR